MKKGLVLLLFFTLISCNETGNSQDVFCTTEAKAGLNIAVYLIESSSSIPISEGVTVVATDGNYSETLQFYDPQNPIFSGAYERPGTYIITVTKPGRQTYISQPIQVMSDICHVIPRNINVLLLP
jgi:hypothetical protein